MELVKIKKVKGNKLNPRLIKEDKFEKLVQSIKDFPEMLKLRPIVVNKDMTVLGGNMRLKACIEAGLKEVYILKAVGLTKQQENEFIVKDNVAFGEWDWDIIANEWDTLQLDDWGFKVPDWGAGVDYNMMELEESDILEEFDAVGKMDGKQRVVFLFDGEEEAESYLNNLNIKFQKRNMAWQVNLTTDIQ